MRAGQIFFDGAPETLSDPVLRQIYGAQEPCAKIDDAPAPIGEEMLWPARA
jgi:ABC-type phosphate/phosphonate transport system ATPase subunit